MYRWCITENLVRVTTIQDVVYTYRLKYEIYNKYELYIIVK